MQAKKDLSRDIKIAYPGSDTKVLRGANWSQ